MKTILTPSAAILKDPTRTTPEQITDIITPVVNGIIPVKNGEIVQGYNVTSYNYNLVNITDICKVNKLEKITAAVTGKQTSVKVPGENGYNFSVIIPAENRTTLYFKDCILSKKFAFSTGLQCLAGKDNNGKTVFFDLAKQPHCLIAGTTGSGKSILLHDIITGLLFRNTPDRVNLLMIDCKQTELIKYNGIPHLLQPVETDPKKAGILLKTLCNLMDNRYKKLSKDPTKHFIPIVLVIDELADLMLQNKKQIEPALIRICQLGRAANIHCIVATQKPSASVITGLISANIPCKICLKCSKVTDSVLILGHKDGEKLTGQGDCIIKQADTITEQRVQAAYISDNDIKAVTDYYKRR